MVVDGCQARAEGVSESGWYGGEDADDEENVREAIRIVVTDMGEGLNKLCC